MHTGEGETQGLAGHRGEAVAAMTQAQAQPWWREPGRGQWLSFLAAWVGWVMDAFDFTIYLLVMPEMAREFGVGVTALSGSITLTLLLRLIGGLAAGSVADRWGRKLPLMISVVWLALCDGAVAMAPTFTWVLVLRTLFGFGMGAEWTSGATLAMENWPERSRGIASGILHGGWAVGYLLAAVVSGFVVPVWGWRALFIIAAVPALLAFPIRFLVPESFDRAKAQAERQANSLRGFSGSGLMTRLVWGSLVMAFNFGGYYGLTSLYPVLLKTELGMTTQGVSVLVTIVNVGMLLGTAMCGALASRLGVAKAVAIAAFGMLPFLPLYVGLAPGLLWLGAFAGGLFGAAPPGIAPLLLTSLFPASIRGKCVGLVFHVGAFLAAFIPMGMAALVEHAGFTHSQVIMLVGGLCLVAMALALLLRPRATLDEAPAPTH
ncbi:MFS transporter [Archangium sp.]|uniref:MFS transporter n=1 Tax=Archangium sp. TaxID=1872627 RepID=UPI003899F977